MDFIAGSALEMGEGAEYQCGNGIQSFQESYIGFVRMVLQEDDRHGGGATGAFRAWRAFSGDQWRRDEELRLGCFNQLYPLADEELVAFFGFQFREGEE